MICGAGIISDTGHYVWWERCARCGRRMWAGQGPVSRLSRCHEAGHHCHHTSHVTLTHRQHWPRLGRGKNQQQIAARRIWVRRLLLCRDGGWMVAGWWSRESMRAPRGAGDTLPPSWRQGDATTEMSISPTYCTFILPQNNEYGWRQDLETKIREVFTITERDG